jgi:hemerythrin-like domain-containing protein
MHDELIKIIKKDHEEVKEIFGKLEKASNKAQREKLVAQLFQEIDPHMVGEEKALYPELQKHKEAKESALEAVEEHHVAKMVLQELLDTPANDERFLAKAIVLKTLILHHIEEEESKIFQMFKKTVSDNKSQQVLDSFNKAKSQRKEALEKEPAMA